MALQHTEQVPGFHCTHVTLFCTVLGFGGVCEMKDKTHGCYSAHETVEARGPTGMLLRNGGDG